MIIDSDDVITASTISPAAMPTIFCLMDFRNMPQGPNPQRRRMTDFGAARKPLVTPAAGADREIVGRRRQTRQARENRRRSKGADFASPVRGGFSSPKPRLKPRLS